MSEKTPATTDRLRVAIDREAQGDKVDFPDPAAAPLDTDAEASGNPPSKRQLKMERLRPGAPLHSDWVGFAVYVGLAILVAALFLTLAGMASGR